MSSMIEKLGKTWGLNEENTKRVLDALEARKWAGCDGLDGIVYAGTIDEDDNPNMLAGHNGYWIADDDCHVCYVTNGDPAWVEWDEATADEIGVEWGEMAESMESRKVSV